MILSYLILAAALFIYMNVWFVIAVITKKNDVADIAWGLGFVCLSWLAFAFSDASARAIVVNILVTIWGLRLAWHIARRNIGKPEDRRYAAWREEWKHFYVRSYFQIFMLQGLLLFLIIQPVLFIQLSAQAPVNIIDHFGIGVWIIGFLFESIGDAQLKRFLSDPNNKGKIMTSGIWAYSRHPNYFGEVTQWWGIFLLAVSLPFGYITIIGPLTITFFILFVSGVPMLEKKYAGRPDFEEYKKKTSAFIPMPQKRHS